MIECFDDDEEIFINKKKVVVLGDEDGIVVCEVGLGFKIVFC